VPAEQPHRFHDPASEPDVQDDARQHRKAAQRRQAELQPPVTLVDAILTLPRLPAAGRHAGALDGGSDVAIGHALRVVRDRHPAIQDVEGHAVFAADERPDLALEDCHLLGAVEARDLERPPLHARLWRHLRRIVVAAAGVPVRWLVPVGLVVLRAVLASGAARGASGVCRISALGHSQSLMPLISCPLRWDLQGLEVQGVVRRPEATTKIATEAVRLRSAKPGHPPPYHGRSSASRP
jgi:hypothetical protein